MKTAIVFFFLFVFAFSCQKMARGKLYHADKEFYNAGKDDPGGLCFPRKLTDNKVYDNGSKSYTIRIPAAFQNINLAWGSTYFTGMKRRRSSPVIFYLIADYDSSVSQIVFDKNGNKDFTDDSIIQIIQKKWTPIRINNHSDPNASIQMDFLLVKDAPDSIYSKPFKVFTHERNDGISPQFITIDRNKYYRRIQLPDSNIVTLYDANVNGTFNDRYDKIIAGDIKKSKKIRHSTLLAKNVRYGAELPFGNTTYRVVEVDKYGNSVELMDLNKRSDTIEKIPAFNFINEENQVVRFNFKNPKDYTVFYIWGAWCPGCWEQAPFVVNLMKKYTEHVEVITLNYGDPVSKMHDYLSKKKYPFTAWRLDQKNVPKLNPDGFPHYIVIDKKQRVLLRTLQVDDVDSFLSKKLATN